MTAMNRLGLFGGTFDPVHFGHLRTVEAARLELGLSKILLLPNPTPPHKQFDPLTPFSHRREMLRLAIEDYPNLEISDIEQEANGPAYTTDTVQRLKRTLQDPALELWLIIGADSLLDLPKWKDPQALFRDAKVAVLPRPGFDLQLVKPEYISQVRILSTPYLDISARNIRARLIKGDSVEDLIPKTVLGYIKEHGLYGT
jgi:nicotinate-nucleotide adenylyltransferase